MQKISAATQVRISTWNCEGAIGKKVEPLARLEADIVVLQEVRQTDLGAFADATSRAWLGPPDGKGIAVVGYGGWVLEQPLSCSEKWFLPVVATRGDARVTILAVWVAPDRGSYILPTVRALRQLRDFVSFDRTIIIGDFNANTAWDTGRSASRYGFRLQLTLLAELGFTSLWHHFRSDKHGAETVATRYHGRKQARPYHVDYAFASNDLLASVRCVTLGSFAEWTGVGHSDHVPLTITLADS